MDLDDFSLRKRDVLRMARLSRVELDRLCSAGRFPKPISVRGRRGVAGQWWSFDEIAEWLQPGTGRAKKRRTPPRPRPSSVSVAEAEAILGPDCVDSLLNEMSSQPR
jgi:predicted DNA-binding transcriptional regulator AlpA